MSRKMTGIVKTFDCKSGKGLITPSDGRQMFQVHISACRQLTSRSAYPGMRV
ncbi:cold shock domain-containing protein [Salmonella enterica subsp. enterica]|nr:cold shock domain-containing protein [Salmonella enterica subsp. enterica]